MSFDGKNKQKVRHRALLEAVRLCGGVTSFSKLLKVSRSRASNWCNRPEIEIPYEYVVLIEHLTHVSIERLSPFTEAANEVIRQQRSINNKSMLINIELNEVLIKDHAYLRYLKRDRPMMIGTDRALISGLMQFENHKASGIRKVSVLVLDIESLLLEKRTIQDMKLDLLISEEVEIGLRLEHLLGNRQGQRNDLNGFPPKNSMTFLPMWEEFQGRRDVKISKTMGYSTNTYYRAKQIYLQGSIELIDAVDRKEISIFAAGQKINDTKDVEAKKWAGLSLN